MRPLEALAEDVVAICENTYPSFSIVGMKFMRLVWQACKWKNLVLASLSSMTLILERWRAQWSWTGSPQDPRNGI
jgi:hypothetical protein